MEKLGECDLHDNSVKYFHRTQKGAIQSIAEEGITPRVDFGALMLLAENLYEEDALSGEIEGYGEVDEEMYPDLNDDPKVEEIYRDKASAIFKDGVIFAFDSLQKFHDFGLYRDDIHAMLGIIVNNDTCTDSFEENKGLNIYEESISYDAIPPECLCIVNKEELKNL